MVLATDLGEAENFVVTLMEEATGGPLLARQIAQIRESPRHSGLRAVARPRRETIWAIGCGKLELTKRLPESLALRHGHLQARARDTLSLGAILRLREQLAAISSGMR